MSVSCVTYRRELHLRPATQGSGRKAACEEGTTADEERMCSKKKSNGSRVEGSGAYVEGEEFRCLVGAGAEVDGDDLEVEALLVEHGGHAHHVLGDSGIPYSFRGAMAPPLSLSLLKAGRAGQVSQF